MPVTSPIAHSPSPAAIRSSTSMPCRSGVDADRLEADALHARAPAGGDEQAVAAELAAVGEHEHDLVVRRGARGGVLAEVELDAVVAQGARRAPRRRGRLAREQALALDQHRPTRRGGGAPAPSRRRPAPPPRTITRPGTSRSPVASRLCPEAVDLVEARDRRVFGSEPVAITTSRAVYVRSPTATAPGPASRPSPRITAMPALSAQATWPASSQSETRKSRHSRPAATSGRGRRRPGARRAPRAPPRAPRPGRSSVLDGMHAQYEHSPPTARARPSPPAPAVGQRARAVLPGRAGAQDDDVVVGVAAPLSLHGAGASQRGRPGQARRCAYPVERAARCRRRRPLRPRRRARRLARPRSRGASTTRSPRTASAPRPGRPLPPHRAAAAARVRRDRRRAARLGPRGRVHRELPRALRGRLAHRHRGHARDRRRARRRSRTQAAASASRRPSPGRSPSRSSTPSACAGSSPSSPGRSSTSRREQDRDGRQRAPRPRGVGRDDGRRPLVRHDRGARARPARGRRRVGDRQPRRSSRRRAPTSSSPRRTSWPRAVRLTVSRPRARRGSRRRARRAAAGGAAPPRAWRRASSPGARSGPRRPRPTARARAPRRTRTPRRCR